MERENVRLWVTLMDIERIWLLMTEMERANKMLLAIAIEKGKVKIIESHGEVRVRR